MRSNKKAEFLSPFQVLVLEPSKVLQPAILCVSEEDQNRTVQLKHITTQKVRLPPAAQTDLHGWLFRLNKQKCTVTGRARNSPEVVTWSFSLAGVHGALLSLMGLCAFMQSNLLCHCVFVYEQTQAMFVLHPAERLTPVDVPSLCDSGSEVK